MSALTTHDDGGRGGADRERSPGNPPNGGFTGPAVRDVIDRYLIHSASNKVHGAEAIAERRRLLERFADAFGHLDIATLMPHHLQDWIDGNQRWRSSSTKKTKANIVNACFNWASNGGRIRENLLRQVDYPEAERRPPMPDEDFAVFKESANKPFDRAITFLRLTGCRLSDLCRLRWEHIDWDRAACILPKHKSVKKTGKPLVFALTPDALELLKKVKAERFREGEVFRNNRGKPWNRRLLGQHLRRLKERLGVNLSASLHGIRHQFATVAIQNGAPLIMVSKQLGHASTAITEKYYVHVDGDIEGRMEAAVNAANIAKPKGKKSAR